MKVFLAIMLLTINFIKSALLSGLDTARIILFKPADTRSGLTRMAYPELSTGYASLLGTLVTLTPGTTLIDIDTSRNELVLHLLDLERRDATLESIRHDFAQPLLTLSGRIT